MKTTGRFLGVIVLLAAIGAGVVWFTPTLRTQAQIKAQVIGLNIGIIPVDRADWGFLKLRAGKAGLDALSDLEHRSPRPEVRRAAIAVENQWWEKGHVFPCDGPICLDPLAHETRFSELRLPPDGMSLSRDLQPGQVIPQSFWDQERFRVGCVQPPKKWTRDQTCTLKMEDLTGDAAPEVIVVTRRTGTMGFYAAPAIAERWAIFHEGKDGWHQVAMLSFGEVDQKTSPDAHGQPAAGRFDTLWLNGHAIDFFCYFCSENHTFNNSHDRSGGAAIARRLNQIERIYGPAPPASLAQALTAGAVDQSRPQYAMPANWEKPVPRSWQGLPPCFAMVQPAACGLIVADIDHDGRDDVIVIQRQPFLEGHDVLRLATLMMQRGNGWQVVASRPVCAAPGQTLDKMSVAFKPAEWRPVEFNGRLYTPDIDNDTCLVPMLLL